MKEDYRGVQITVPFTIYKSAKEKFPEAAWVKDETESRGWLRDVGGNLGVCSGEVGRGVAQIGALGCCHAY